MRESFTSTYHIRGALRPAEKPARGAAVMETENGDLQQKPNTQRARERTFGRDSRVDTGRVV